MRFISIDKQSGNHVYRFNDKGDEICADCREVCTAETKEAGQCKNRYFCRKPATDGEHIFFFCLDKVKTKNQAKQIIKMTTDAYQRSANIREDRTAIADNTVELAIHNTRNLNAEINNKLLSLVGERSLLASGDKIAFIEDALRTSPGRFAREILNILKSTNQIMHEYNVVDFLNANISLRPADFGRHKAHTLYVMSFYLYEQEFRKKDITVQADSSFDEISIHWTTARTAVAQLLDNCLKYCKTHEPVRVRFCKRDENGNMFLDVVFEMTSLYFTSAEGPSLLSSRVRGTYADKLDSRGKGLGLGIIQKMMELNKGTFRYRSNESSLSYTAGGVPYSRNEFTLSFVRA